MKASEITVGLRVQCFFDDDFYDGFIRSVNPDGTYFVQFEDGDELPDAVLSELRARHNGDDESRDTHPGGTRAFDVLNIEEFGVDSMFTQKVTAEFLLSGNEPGSGPCSPTEQKHLDHSDVSVSGNGEAQTLFESVNTYVESQLLPGLDERYLIKRNKIEQNEVESFNRFTHLLSQVAIAEHIRTTQTLYRDPDDELRLVPELRGDNPSVQRSTKTLIKKITEGRTRICSLCRIIYGDKSLEFLRAKLDLANCYALQGMWQQVSQHVASCDALVGKLNCQAHHQQFTDRLRVAQVMANRIQCIFSILRANVSQNFGRVVIPTLLEDLSGRLLEIHADDDQINAEIEEMIRFRFKFDSENPKTEDMSVKRAMVINELLASIEKFAAEHSNSSSSSPRSTPLTAVIQNEELQMMPSYGALIDFLRNKCQIMRFWQRKVEALILPQNRVAMELAFQLVDPQRKGVSHPQDIKRSTKSCTSAAKVVTGDTFTERILGCKCEISLLIDTSMFGFSNLENTTGNSGDGSSQIQTGIYELPMTIDETMAIFLTEVAVENPLYMIQLQLLNLKGVLNMFTGNLDEAEQNLKEALTRLKELNLDSEMFACELYNSIAQLMILKYRQWQSDRKIRCKKEAVKFLTTSEGIAQIKRDMLRYVQRTEDLISINGDDDVEDIRSVLLLELPKKNVDEIEVKVKNSILRNHLKELLESGKDSTTLSVEAAFRYLVRSFEILESTHGDRHPALGAASLAVASVQNAVGKFNDAREWLGTTIRVMERLDPIPVRALAFCRVQLGNVLLKQEYIEECVCVLTMAIQFYRESALKGIDVHRKRPIPANSEGTALAESLIYSEMLMDDIDQYFTLMEKLVNICKNHGGINESLGHTMSMLEFADLAFGWDSEQVALYQKSVGELASSLSNWPLAVKTLKLALDSHISLYGSGDKQVSKIKSMLQIAVTELSKGSI